MSKSREANGGRMAPIYFRQSEIFVPEVIENVPARVVRLLNSGGPNTIRQFVIAMNIDAVDRMPSGGTRAHVSDEIFETISPPIANRNAPSAIPFVRRSFRIGAALIHGGPDRIMRIFGQAVGAGLVPCVIATTTGTNGPGPQRRDGRDFLVAALTLTEPKIFGGPRNGGQAAEALTGNIHSSVDVATFHLDTISTRHQPDVTGVTSDALCDLNARKTQSCALADFSQPVHFAFNLDAFEDWLLLAMIAVGVIWWWRRG